jgi:urea transport system permease protein
MQHALKHRMSIRMSADIRARAVLILLLAIGLFSVPWWASYYQITLIRDGLILGCLALSLDFLWGKAGLPSFGHAVFFGLGGYLYAVVATHLDSAYGPILGALAAVAGGAAFGLFLGLFLLRAGVRGSLFLIVTVALTQIGRQIAISWSAVTGGDAGLVSVPPLGFSAFSIEWVLFDPAAQCWFASVLSLSLLSALWLATRGRFGRILSAIANDETRALTLGINASWQLTLALTISTSIAALSGAVYVSMVGVMVPDLIGPLFSIEVVAWVFVGGLGTLLGPFIGTFLVWRLSQAISSYNPILWQLAVGAFFVMVPFLFPQGVLNIGRNLWPLLRWRTEKREAA